ncbi:DNA-directed DNA polymerase [Spizellomyces sp. 'palustris']|nr:DNA-directed DNA polymerase [Spizellomyces sp. 'palustris']
MAFPGGFREYMAVKRRKLEVQGQEIAATGSQSSVLTGLTLYFNGYTGSSDLTMIQFKELVLVHGALVRDKLEPDVTHIIATQMTDSKMRNLRKPVVKPEWLLDSIKRQNLLPWLTYRLYTDIAPSQQTLGSFFSGGTSQSGDQPSSTSTHGGENELITSAEGNLEKQILGTASEKAQVEHVQIEEEAIADEGEGEVESDESESEDVRTRQGADTESEWVKANTCTAPGFLQKFFASSRLHHLSTWKGELRDFVYRQGPRRRMNATTYSKRIIVHVDMDCYFASVALRDRPHLQSSPVVVAHSLGLAGRSTSDVASCNYVARSHGLRNGMSLGRAREICKDLHVLPYEFEKYEACTKALYNVLLRQGDEVEAVSCDEAYVDVTSSIKESGQEIQLAENLRREIFEVTGGCAARSAITCIGPNKLLARMATTRAKPNGVFQVKQEEALQFMEGQLVRDLPGVGWVLADKAAKRNIKTCKELAVLSLPRLQADFGPKTGSMLYNACRGIDMRPLENTPRQSVGAEVNWGIRFTTQDQVEQFIRELSQEINKRMKLASVGGKLLTVKAKKKRYVGEPQKVLGCGDCDNLSKSWNAQNGINSWETIFRESYRLLCELQIEATDIRGVGIHVSKLCSDSLSLPGHPVREQSFLNFEGAAPDAQERNNPPPHKMEDHRKTLDEQKTTLSEYGINPEEIDLDVLKELPEEIQADLLPYLKARESHHRPFQINARAGCSSSSSSISKPNGGQQFDPSYLLPTASQVDPEVMKALPDEIRQDLEKAIGMRRGMAARSISGMRNVPRRGKIHGNKVSPNKGQVQLQSRRQSITCKSIPVPPPSPSLGGQSDFGSVRCMLEDWVSTRLPPTDDDVNAFLRYLESLIDEMELERLETLLKWFFCRVGVESSVINSKGKGNAEWSKVAEMLTTHVNEMVMKKYGCQMKGLGGSQR